MNTRQALEESVKRERGIASIAKRVAVEELHRKLREQIGLFKGALEADDWKDAATHAGYLQGLLQSLHENEEASGAA
jgi:hypothetical protein